MVRKTDITRRLPPLRALRVFEAVARHESVTTAADELCVSHSAVSQQIRVLEEYFGQTLFRRSGRGIEPTLEAAAYMQEVRFCLDRLAVASEEMLQRTAGRCLKVNATPSFAMRWLIPFAAQFRADYPDVLLNISTSVTDDIDHLGEPYDFLIRRDIMKRADHECRRVVDDVSTVLVSPGFLHQHRIAYPMDLLGAPLLHLKSRPNAWKHWLADNGVISGEAVAGTFFDHFFLSLQAAINGLGAAIGPYALVQDDLAHGRLVTPFPDRTLVGPGFHVLYRTAALEHPAGRQFLDALLRQSVAGVAAA